MLKSDTSPIIKGVTCYHIGDALKKRGGISSVLILFLSNYQHIIRQKHISSHLGRARIFDYIYFFKAIIQVIFICIWDKSPIFQIHTATRGSFLRKSIFAGIIRIFHKKYIVHMHATDFDKFFETSSPKKQTAIINYLQKSVMVIALSESWKRVFKQYVPDNQISVIYNPCVIYPKSGKRAERKIPRMLFLGRIGERKGSYDLIKAIEIIKDAEFEMDIYGDGEVEKLKIFSEKLLGKTSKIRIHGWISHEKVHELYKNADILVLPSYHEGLPMAILEAMGRGLGIISTYVGGISEAVIDGENGFLINPGDVRSLAEKMMLLINDRELLIKMAKKSSKIASEKFSVEIIGQKLAAMHIALNLCSNA